MASRRTAQLAFLLVVLVAFAAMAAAFPGGHGGGHKKVIIHVPYHVKKIHHTHTVYKIIDHGHGGGGHETIESWSGGDLGGHGW